MLIDTHCHLQFNAYKDDAEEVIKRCREKEMKLITVGSQYDTSKRAVEYAEKYPEIYASVGLHPIHLISAEVDEEEIQFKSREEKFDYEAYKKLAEHPKTVAIGECGLELFHLPEGMGEKTAIEIQSKAFVEQYNLAREFDLPIIIHVRNAHTQMIELLKTLGQPIKGVVHCYTGNWNNAREYIKLGLHIGFTGVITFPARKTDPKTQEDLLETVKNCPLDRILIETDAPYLAPQAYRGQRCEPWMVEEVAKKIAEIKSHTAEAVITQTTENALRLFTKIGL